MALVYGEAGIGKTSLVDHFARARGAAGPHAVGRLRFPPHARPLGPVYDIAPQAGPRARAPRRGRAAAGDLLAVLEELGSARPSSWCSRTCTGRTRRRSTWSSSSAAASARCPRSLVLTYRDDELGPRHPLRIVLGDLATSAACGASRCRRSRSRRCATLAAGQPLDPAALHRQTGGNPFFVTEALASREAGIPPTVRDAVLARAARLSPAGRAALDAAALVGAQVEPWLLAALVGRRGRRRRGVRRRRHAPRPGRRRWPSATSWPGRRSSTRSRRRAGARSTRLRCARSRRPRRARRPGPARPPRRGRRRCRPPCWPTRPPPPRRAAALGAHREAADQYARALRFAGAAPTGERARLLEAYADECMLVDRLDEAIRARGEAIGAVPRGRRPPAGRPEPGRHRGRAGPRRPQRRKPRRRAGAPSPCCARCRPGRRSPTRIGSRRTCAC